MGIGGDADLFFRLEDVSDAEKLVPLAKKSGIPFVILGGGSNVVFSDGGFRGLVIRMEAKKIEAEKSIISAEAGALLSQIIQFALKNNLTGLEKMTGIPGTIGGAVRGNAGAHGKEIRDVFLKAMILDEKNHLREVGPEHFDFSYRHSSVKNSKDVILKVWLSLKKDEEEAKKAGTEALEIIKQRTGKQPKGKCSGSFFRNPSAELTAGYLLDQSGCKNLQVGGAKVALEHANWIINLGNATQKDVLELSKMMAERVLHRFDIKLEREVQFIGETSFISG